MCSGSCACPLLQVRMSPGQSLLRDVTGEQPSPLRNPGAPNWPKRVPQP